MSSQSTGVSNVRPNLSGSSRPYQAGRKLKGKPDEASSTPIEIISGDLVHPNFNKFCKWFNDIPLKFGKALWPLYPVLQAAGLISKTADDFARAWYGFFWSIVYSAYRPFKDGRDELTDEKAPKPIPSLIKNAYKLNEHFRVGIGSLVSLIYGGGALGMLWGLAKRDEDFYERSSEVYQTGMFNQNQIFTSMNLGIVLKRMFNKNQLSVVDRSTDNIKAKIEVIDSVLFLPNIITRTMATLGLLGMKVNESLQTLVNALGYINYGTWACKYGNLKKAEDLAPVRKGLEGSSEKVDLILHEAQKTGAWVFSTTLPIISWLAAGFELFGYRDFAKNTFKLEGYLEKLNPMIAAWCIRDTWFKWFFKSDKKETAAKGSK